MRRTTACPKCGTETLIWYTRCPVCGEKMHKDEVVLVSRSGITLLPKSLLGKWSLILAAVYVVLISASLILARVLFRAVSHPVTPNPTIFIIGCLSIAGYFSGLAATITGIVTILKNKERSILIFLVVVICGFFSIAWLYLASHI